jgi:hypothetical protein
MNPIAVIRADRLPGRRLDRRWSSKLLRVPQELLDSPDGILAMWLVTGSRQLQASRQRAQPIVRHGTNLPGTALVRC